MDNESIDLKYERLKNILKEMKSVLVAFSGGVDSALLLKVATEVLAEDCILAVTARSETTARHEMAAAIDMTARLGVGHLLFPSEEMNLPEFVSNPADRCYICKKSRFGQMVQLAKERGFDWVADGTNFDDHADFRPGMRAIRELGVRSPLSEAHLNKEEIRLLSKQLGLPTWDKPSSACLASRIPYATPITADKLRQVDAGEEFIRGLGLAQQVRVRHYGDMARIEVEPDSIALLTESSTRKNLLDVFKKIGFKYVVLDLEGYQMGSMNKVLDRERLEFGQQSSQNASGRFQERASGY